MKIKTQELTGAALDFAVAVCENVKIDDNCRPIWFEQDELNASRVNYTPSTNWVQGGPIIERDGICIDLLLSGSWLASSRRSEETPWMGGATPLIAAMRCHVASRLGDEVEVPNEMFS